MVGEEFNAWDWSGLLPERVTKIRWTQRSTQPKLTEYDSQNPEHSVLQVQGSFNWKPDLIHHSMRNTTYKQSACSVYDLSEDQLMGKDFDPFSIHSTMARDRVVSFVNERELVRLNNPAEVYASFFPGQKYVKELECSVHLEFVNQPVFLPAYLCEYTRFGRNFRCFVNGVDGRIYGQRQFSFLKASMLATMPLQLIQHLASGGDWPSILWAKTVGMPSFLVGAFMAFMPFYRQFLRERVRLQYLQQTGGYKDRAQEDHDQWMDHEEARERMAEDEVPSGTVASPSGRVKPFYAELGVPENVSVEELKRAFQTLSFRWHPDFHLNRPTKAEAAERYRRIMDAYKTLRNPKKRRLYDLGLG